MRKALAVVASLAAIAAVSALLDRTRREIDLTQDRALTLTVQTREIVAGIDEPVRISAFIPRQDAGRADAAALLGRFRRLSDRIRFRILDPDEAPGEASRLGVDPVGGGVIIEGGGEVERAPAVSELELASALARIQRPSDPTVCFTTGHGERSPKDDSATGFGSVGRTLESNGYEVREVDLLATSTIPDECEAIAIASPTAPLGEQATAELVRWFGDAGRALVLADPESSVDLGFLTEPMAMRIERGIVFEAQEGARLPGDPVTPVVTEYRSGYPFVSRLAPTFYPGVQVVVVNESSGIDGLSVSTFAQTTELAYLDRQPAQPAFDPDVDLAGPVGLGAAADRSLTEGDRTTRARMVVIGDADFASNRFVADGGNGNLVVNVADWLTSQDTLVAISPNVSRSRPLALTRARARYAVLVASGAIPALFLLAGAMVWAGRRHR